MLLPAFGFVKYLSIQILFISLWQWVSSRQIDHFLCVNSKCWKLKQGLVFNSCLSLELYFWGWKAALGWLSTENSWGWCAVWDCSSHVPQERNWIQLFYSCAVPFSSWQLWERVLNCWKSNVWTVFIYTGIAGPEKQTGAARKSSQGKCQRGRTPWGMVLEGFAGPGTSTELGPALRELKAKLEVDYWCKQCWLFYSHLQDKNPDSGT